VCTIHLTLAMTAALLIAADVQADVVERRGAASPLTGRVTLTDDNGVHVRSEFGAAHFVPWDRVRAIDTELPIPQYELRMSTAEDLWRARSRVERGDALLAQSLFERLFETYRGETHETALVVAEGLLRCRLARGENAAAVIPALEAARIRRAGVTTDSYAALPPVIDDELSLCPQLAPAWIESRALSRLERDLAEYDAQEDAVIGALARLYLRAVRRHLGTPEPEDEPVDLPRGVHNEPGVELVADLVACASADSDARAGARARIERRRETLPAWAEAWTRYAVGASLLEEDGVGRRQRGIVELLHVPVRFARRMPYLAGLALSLAAQASAADGDDDAAEVLRAELARRFPNHPVRAVMRSGVEAQPKDEP
jgi:hypothetical protein